MQTAWFSTSAALSRFCRGAVAAATIALILEPFASTAAAAPPAKKKPAARKVFADVKLANPDDLFGESEPPIELKSAISEAKTAAADRRTPRRVKRASAEGSETSRKGTTVAHETAAAPRELKTDARPKPITAATPPAPAAPVQEPRWALKTVKYRGGATVVHENLTPATGRAAIPASMSQLPPPAPPEEGSVPATPSINPPATPPAGTAAVPPAGGTVAEADKLGDAPESNNLQFLRTQAVLLEPGQCQFDYGLTYSVLDSNFATAIVDDNTGNVIGVADTRVRQRQLIVPLAVRYGWSESIQLFANLPVGWANTEVSFGGISADKDVGGIGDIEAGGSVLLKEATEPYRPDIIFTLSFSAPTGDATLPQSSLEPAETMGEGYWSLSQSLLFVHTIDPVVVFYGVGYRHRFDNDFGNDIHADPGEEFNYQLGTGFAVNPWITLSGSVLGAHLTDLEINGTDIKGSDRDPIRLRLSVTAAKGCCIIEPFAEVGMTNDAASRVGIVFTY